MSTLSEHVDRLAHLANAIRANATAAGRQEGGRVASGSSAGPFTRAVLQTHLGDLIRDIDPSELGLFTLVQPSQPGATYVAQEDAPPGPKAEITRVALPIATPLRRPPANYKREEGQKPGEHEPEVYAHAALKFLDRYQSIRPMPRYQEQAEHILEQLQMFREKIRSLNEKIKQSSVSEPNQPQVSPKSLGKQEERRIAQAQARIVELKKQKEVLLRKSKLGPSKGPKSSSRVPVEPRAPLPDEQEQDFWNTPGAAARTLHFTGELLTDEHIDVGDMPESLGSPTRASAPRSRGTSSRALQFTSRSHSASIEPEQPPEQDVEEPDEPPELSQLEPEADEDVTVMLQRPPSVESSRRMVRSPPQPEPLRRVQAAADVIPKREKTKVSAELEVIVAKIWATVGETIMPGRQYDLTRPPKAQETIAHLQSLATQTPSLDSPSTSSLSSLATGTQPAALTSQHILTACMLLALLNSPPNYAMSLGALKDTLAKAEGAAAGVTRPIYGCVAKRLLKIERGGGEQVVKFDV
ncbi:uncharacterized protein PHACADRAFT_145606 [Phanerochaete carnosa HHB-10118-sp]|uniref:Uncharacterized protein n=1 Tax=Phanerochaete carnosa (strain HHB-10118-sp) TaxID=650164 RepID=K5UVH7_PHACS|nr:uncharacterized protein PHACADRAFT_145606 [Phanerochaete carnosa HHB-10118-sp]EKM54026.1 hypothetical protein PHACADRAFT_145606 [Phanerochaete carnosa HHB-10118-sp]